MYAAPMTWKASWAGEGVDPWVAHKPSLGRSSNDHYGREGSGTREGPFALRRGYFPLIVDGQFTGAASLQLSTPSNGKCVLNFRGSLRVWGDRRSPRRQPGPLPLTRLKWHPDLNPCSRGPRILLFPSGPEFSVPCSSLFLCLSSPRLFCLERPYPDSTQPFSWLPLSSAHLHHVVVLMESGVVPMAEPQSLLISVCVSSSLLSTFSEETWPSLSASARPLSRWPSPPKDHPSVSPSKYFPLSNRK